MVLERIRNTFPSKFAGIAALLCSSQYFWRSTKHSNSGCFHVTCFQSLGAYRIFSLFPLFFVFFFFMEDKADFLKIEFIGVTLIKVSCVLNFLAACLSPGLLLPAVLSVYLGSPFSLETVPVFLSCSMDFLPCIFSVWSFGNFCHS